MRSPTLRVEQRQQQTLSPRLQQAVRLLQLSSLDFAQEVHEALGRNPFLEGEEADLDAGTASDTPAPLPDPEVGETPVTADAQAATTSVATENDGERESWQADTYTAPRHREDGETNLMDLMAVETSLANHLHGQLNVLPLSVRDRVLAKCIVESLDDDGYLRISLEELAGCIAELDPAPTADELLIALKRVRGITDRARVSRPRDPRTVYPTGPRARLPRLQFHTSLP